MAMRDIPSIESTGVSARPDAKASHREARIMCMCIYASTPKCVNLFLSP